MWLLFYITAALHQTAENEYGYDLKGDFLTLAGAGRCGNGQRLQRLVNGLIIVACHADGGDEGKDQIDVAIGGFVVGADAARHSVDEVGQGNRHGFAVRHAFGFVAFVVPALRQAKVAVGVVLHGGEIGVFGGGVIAGAVGCQSHGDDDLGSHNVFSFVCVGCFVSLMLYLL